MSVGRRAFADGLATALLLAVVVGSGIMGERLAAGNTAVALLANALATGCGLAALIVTFAPISGAHMNPLVTIALAVRGDHAWRDVPGFVVAQLTGAVLGVWVAHAMFDLPIIEMSHRVRVGRPQLFSETIATFGLLVVVLRGSRQRPDAVPWTVACYITAAYWFTASTSFANPAVTIARSLTDTFAGIAPAGVAGFCAAQCVGAALAVGVDRGFNADRPASPPVSPEAG
ncbi:MAG: MIP/aquaporin family protein [Dokdonella sp.]|uniref:MIP/aquaporin family protein n=1 Tax=Dokdonella sp. TaxID=2291710 RepID=UPI0032639E99